jgi:uncharacterized membrane protein
MISEIKNYALSKLEGKWGLAIGVAVLNAVISVVVGIIPGLGSIGGILIGGPLALGIASFFLKLVRGQDARLEDLFSGFQNFGSALLASILMGLLIGLGFIFLIIPGIIVALGFSQTYNVLHDNPQIGGWEAMMKSWQLMKGKKGNYFGFTLSFLGWALLATLPMGLSMGRLYETFKDNASAGQMTNVSDVLGLGMSVALPVLVSMLAFIVLGVYFYASNARYYDAEVREEDITLQDFADELQ